MILIDKINTESILSVVAYLIETGEFYSIFKQLSDEVLHDSKALVAIQVIFLILAQMHSTSYPKKSLRDTFNEIPLLYNEARPCYPAELFSTLVDVAALQKDSTLLEIGPGTGQATKPLAEKGFHITAIELGDSLAELARQQLQRYKNVQVVTGTFEETILPPASFDLVFAATSFHWIEPPVRFSKSHTVLKNKGHLAIIHTNHISDEKGDLFFNASQPIFDRYQFTGKYQKPNLPKSEELKVNDIDDRLFKLVHFQLFPVTVTYSARQFSQLLNTFSNHLAAPKEVQHAFYEEIETLIHNSFQGKIDKHFCMSLTVAEKI